MIREANSRDLGCQMRWRFNPNIHFFKVLSAHRLSLQFGCFVVNVTDSSFCFPIQHPG